MGLPTGLQADLETRLAALPNTRPEEWLFPSETLVTPLWKDALWKVHVRPKLESSPMIQTPVSGAKL
jgi:hypothetical protein